MESTTHSRRKVLSWSNMLLIVDYSSPLTVPTQHVWTTKYMISIPRVSVKEMVCGGEGNGTLAMIRPDHKSTALMLDLASNFLGPGNHVLDPFTGHFQQQSLVFWHTSTAGSLIEKWMAVVFGLRYTGWRNCTWGSYWTTNWTWPGTRSCWFMQKCTGTRWMCERPEGKLMNRVPPIVGVPIKCFGSMLFFICVL